MLSDIEQNFLFIYPLQNIQQVRMIGHIHCFFRLRWFLKLNLLFDADDVALLLN